MSDFSVVGYDVIETAKYFNPPLTTVQQPKYKIGSLAMEILLKKIAGETGLNEINIQPRSLS